MYKGKIRKVLHSVRYVPVSTKKIDIDISAADVVYLERALPYFP